MLSKLLKYELRASGRILLPVYALLLASAGCCSLFTSWRQTILTVPVPPPS